MTLRPYQQVAHDAVMNWIKVTTHPCVVEAATGAGKSHLIAALAKTVHRISGGKRVLCIAPSVELVLQNHEKYIATGNPASIFSASAGQKCLQHPVVFGTPMSIKNGIEAFTNQIAMIVLDECHGITPTIIGIIDAIRAKNPTVRVVGTTATPYRMVTGYIYAQFPDGSAVPEHRTREPYFEKCVDRITARELIEMGFLTPPVIGRTGVDGYQALGLKLNKMGQFNAGEIDAAFVGKGRKTARIIADIVEHAQGREGVMVFASTVAHAHECFDSLPGGMSAIVTGNTPAKERADILKRFKAKKIKYIVNVSVLTIGFDAPHVDLIAILRPTESAGLLQQIIGRGLRISPDKQDVLVLDYAENIERHCPDGQDIFDPNIEVGPPTSEAMLKCFCPKCHMENEFRARPNKARLRTDREGYFLDLDGERVQDEDYGDMPGHYGRRCQTRHVVRNEIVRCDYRWTSKDCPHCGAENDIAARQCEECKGEIVDPNEKLRLAFKAKKKDPTKVQCDEVLAWEIWDTVSKAGNPTYRIDVVTPYRSFSFWVLQHPKYAPQAEALQMIMALRGEAPRTITYRRNRDNDFYNILAYNRPKDEDPTRNTGIRRPELSRPVPDGAGRADHIF